MRKYGLHRASRFEGASLELEGETNELAGSAVPVCQKPVEMF